MTIPPVPATRSFYETLFCNHHLCRTELQGEIYVTDCSHAFCTSCLEAVEKPVCPACETDITPETTRLLRLPPYPEWNGNLLVGLRPAEVLECAKAALAFWSYQQGQNLAVANELLKQEREVVVDEKNELLKDKYAKELQIALLETKLAETSEENRETKEKFAEIDKAFAETKRQLSKLQSVYAASRQKSLLQNNMSSMSIDQMMMMGVAGGGGGDHCPSRPPGTMMREDSRPSMGMMREDSRPWMGMPGHSMADRLPGHQGRAGQEQVPPNRPFRFSPR